MSSTPGRIRTGVAGDNGNEVTLDETLPPYSEDVVVQLLQGSSSAAPPDSNVATGARAWPRPSEPRLARPRALPPPDPDQVITNPDFGQPSQLYPEDESSGLPSNGPGSRDPSMGFSPAAPGASTTIAFTSAGPTTAAGSTPTKDKAPKPPYVAAFDRLSEAHGNLLDALSAMSVADSAWVAASIEFSRAWVSADNVKRMCGLPQLVQHEKISLHNAATLGASVLSQEERTRAQEVLAAVDETFVESATATREELLEKKMLQGISAGTIPDLAPQAIALTGMTRAVIDDMLLHALVFRARLDGPEGSTFRELLAADQRNSLDSSVTGIVSQHAGEVEKCVESMLTCVEKSNERCEEMRVQLRRRQPASDTVA